MTNLKHAQLRTEIPSKLVFVVSPSETITRAMPRDKVEVHCNVTLFRLRMTEIPRVGEYISLAKFLHRVIEVEWSETEDLSLPYHPVLSVEAAKDPGGIAYVSSSALEGSE